MSGVKVSYCFLTGLIFPAIVFAVLPGVAYGIDLYGPGGKRFDIQDHYGGELTDGTDDAYDGCYRFSVNSMEYDAGRVSGTIIWGGRGVQMNPMNIEGLVVRRTAWVPDTGGYDYIRYFDTIENTTSAPQSVVVTYSGDLGSDSSTTVTASSSGDLTVDTSDGWFCTDDRPGRDPSLGHVLWGEGGIVVPDSETLSGDDLSITFTVEIAPGERVGFVIFGIQADDSATAQSGAEFLAEFPDEAQEGLTGDDFMDIVNWGLTGAPIIRFTASEYVVQEGGSIDISVEVEDPEGDPVEVRWDLDGDGVFTDGEGTDVTFSAVGLDGPSTVQILVEASDGENVRTKPLEVTVENVPPEFVSEPEVTQLHRGEEWTYQIEVQDQANIGVDTVLDYLTVVVLEKPSDMVFSGGDTLKWDVPRSDAVVGDHPVRIQCSDGDEGIALQEFTLTVVENAPPTKPEIISPKQETVATLTPTLIVANAEDPDGDRLFYNFEVATIGTFVPSSIVVRSTQVEDPTGQTSWTVDKELEDGKRYYWRVWAEDDDERGPADSTFFDVDLSSSPSEDGGEEMDVVGDIEAEWSPWVPDEGGEGGCSCEVLPADGSGDFDLIGGWLRCLLVFLIVFPAMRIKGKGRS